MKRLPVLLLVFALVAVLLSFTPPGTSITSAATKATLTVDVALDGGTFIANKVDATAGSIRKGDYFLLTGKIFEGGTIPEGGTKDEPSSFGPDSEGSIGDWICRGTYLVDAEDLSSAILQRATTQYFLLPDKNRIFTEGFEGDATITRIIVGGTGEFRGARGTSTVTRLGTNATGAYNLRFEFETE